jgi:hypothetical protein
VLRAPHISRRVERANALLASGAHAAALTIADALIEEGDSLAPAYHIRGQALFGIGRQADALNSFMAAVEAGHKEAAYHCATLLALQERHDEAIEYYRRALHHMPSNVRILSNFATSLYALGQLDEAIQLLERAIVLDPANSMLTANRATIEYNKAAAALAAGCYAEGFAAYEHRRRIGVVDTPDFSEGRPQWRGEETGKRLYLWAEMGVGEEIFFSSFVADACSRSSRIVVGCDKRLMSILERSFPALEAVVDVGGMRLAFDVQCALPSLPFVLGVGVPPIERPRGYLKPDAARVRQFMEKYKALARSRPIVGLSWRSKNPRFGQEKSAELRDWEALLRRDCLFVSLQYGDVREEAASVAEAFGCEVYFDETVDQMTDLEGFFAQVSALDQVVTVSNTTAHVAGALGQECIVMMPKDKSLIWYWGDGRSATPWYPGHRVVAQMPESGVSGQVARCLEFLAPVLAR